MIFKQFYLGCLAQASYLIGDGGEAAVIDPRRDVDEYLAEAKAQGLTIKHIIETHLHADFVSGHLELAERTGAKIHIGHRARAGFPHVPMHEGDVVRVGQVTLRCLETPGHTPESISIAVVDEKISPQPCKILTGDTLFIGEVGRPDLVGTKGHTAQEMAAMLYDSLWNKILKLPDQVEVYPAHGAGSLCGRNISKETFSTLGEQRRSNYALKPMSKDDFIALTTADLPEVPDYFAHDVETNRRGAPALAAKPRLQALSAVKTQELLRAGVTALDVRPSAQFGNGHVPGSLNIALSGMFASWAGALIGPNAKILLIADDPGMIDEAAMRLARVGLEEIVGYLDGGIAAWEKAGLSLQQLPQWPVDEFRQQLRERGQSLQIIDVRRPAEFASGHVAGAKNIPLARLSASLGEVMRDRPTAIVCGSGYRSSAAAGILEHHGLRELYNIVGGMTAWNAAQFEVES